MPKIENLNMEKRIKDFFSLVKDNNEVKLFFSDYRENMLKLELLYLDFFYNFDDFLNFKTIHEKIITEQIAENNQKLKNETFNPFKTNKSNDKLFLIKDNLQKKAMMLEVIHNILLELRVSIPKREMEQSMYLKTLLLYFNDTTIEGKTLKSYEYEQWAAKFIELAMLEMNTLQGFDLDNIKIITDLVRTLFLDVFRDKIFQKKYNLKVINQKLINTNQELLAVKAKNQKLNLDEPLISTKWDAAFAIINSQIFKTYMEQLPIFIKEIPEYIKEISNIKKYNVLVNYKLFNIQRDKIGETITIMETTKKELEKQVDEYKTKIKNKENENNTFDLLKMELELVSIVEIINTLKLIEEYKNSDFIFAIRGIWKLVLTLYFEETNYNKQIKIEEFQKWIDRFIEICKNQGFDNTQSDKFENLINFIAILENFKRSIATNIEFQEEVAITIVSSENFLENVNTINGISDLITTSESKSVFYI